ncbi:peptidylprolyl isomerase [Porphyrobacter sp. ULC335]|uniref:peptidylprolyl isomerase n=1 Tax=Porphyrobacter sp. ULC335 TaxID=2854260 RepID=UPI0022200639|nr:peptidylprolyl isomerase [Porphyrobacter sp. ULC335]UYV14856.1 SurA N-terminal domain-containing protein [Porphyrobacter sp. ULC335]
MISFFRRFFASKIGLPIVLAFLGLMALAFAASDITGSTFGGISNNDRMAVVGGEAIPISDLTVAANSALDQVRGQNPTLTMPEFIAEGGLDEVIDQLIDRFTVGEYGREYGLRAGDNLVNSEILKIPAFQGLTGSFDEKTYIAALRSRGLTDAMFRRDLADGLIEQQLLRSAVAAPQLPEKIARQYAALVLEKRKGEIALIPSAAFAPTGNPSDAQLTAWYKDNRTQFIRPERRTLRFAVFGSDSLKVNAVPTPAEIAERFKRDAAKYQASEKRAVTSFVVPTEDAAKALATRIRSGANLETVAREAGFTASKSEARDREAMSGATSFAFAQNTFKAAQGGLIEPAQGTLGWYVARVDSIEKVGARSLAQATPEITEALSAEKRVAAIADRVAEIEGEIDGGTALAEVAKAYGLKVETTPSLLANGQAFGQPQVKIVPQLVPVLQTAFQMEESEPQLAEVVPGEQFVIFEVARVEEASAPPLAEVREGAIAAWKRTQGAVLAKQASERILAKVRAGTPLAAALAAENKPGFEREAIDLERRQLLAQSQGRIPPPLVLMFSMAEGTAKTLEGPRDLGWYIVNLEDISTLPLDKEGQLIAQTRQQLGSALSEEYRQQATAAMRKELGVTRNDAGIAAVRKQLSGEQ